MVDDTRRQDRAILRVRDNYSPPQPHYTVLLGTRTPARPGRMREIASASLAAALDHKLYSLCGQAANNR